MKKRTRNILRVIAGFLILLTVAGAWFYVVIWMPHQKLYRDEAWWNRASETDIRNLSHHIIRHRPGYPHDAFLQLRHIGNAESVPLLIQALKWQKPGEDDLYICTTVHCVDALRSLTGKDYGFSAAAWAQWWKQTGSKLPDDHFYPREVTNEDGNPSSHVPHSSGTADGLRGGA